MPALLLHRHPVIRSHCRRRIRTVGCRPSGPSRRKHPESEEIGHKFLRGQRQRTACRPSPAARELAVGYSSAYNHHMQYRVFHSLHILWLGTQVSKFQTKVDSANSLNNRPRRLCRNGRSPSSVSQSCFRSAADEEPRLRLDRPARCESERACPVLGQPAPAITVRSSIRNPHTDAQPRGLGVAEVGPPGKAAEELPACGPDSSKNMGTPHLSSQSGSTDRAAGAEGRRQAAQTELQAALSVPAGPCVAADSEGRLWGGAFDARLGAEGRGSPVCPAQPALPR